MDLTAIQDKLKRQSLAFSQHSLEVPIDWPAQAGLITYAPNRSPSTQLTTTVDRLRRRSLRAYGESGGQAGVSLPPYPGTVDPSCTYQQRLQSVVDKINHLASEQRRAIAELQATHRQLAEGPVPATAHSAHGFSSPQITLDRAATTSAELDARGNIRLTHQPIRLQRPDQEARQLAGHLRKTYGPSSPLPAPSGLVRSVWVSMLAILGQEPLSGLIWVWRSLQSLVIPLRPDRRRPLQKARAGRRVQVFPSFVDALLWLGAGVITRLALDLLLSSFSGLWPLTVLGITAIVAYALYQATLASKPELGLANRVFLALAGLFMGGYL